MKTIDSTTRRALRARAHSLDPVVMIGNQGLSQGVITEVDRSLKAHELIKIRIAGAEHDARSQMCEEICEKTGAVPVQHIGKILVIYRENPEEAQVAKVNRARTTPQRPPSGRGKKEASFRGETSSRAPRKNRAH